MKKFVMGVLGAVAFALAATGAAQALQLTFFGADIGPGDAAITPTPGGPLPSHPNADTAQAAFLTLLPGVRIEDFEGFPAATLAPLSMSFAQPSGTVTATLSGILGSVRAENSVDLSVGQYPISRPNYWQSAFSPVALLALSLDFSVPQAAFGFYGVDIGDAGAQVSLELGLPGGGALPPVNIPHTLGATATTGGSVLYFGLINTDTPFTRVTFLSPPNSANDGFGFDNFTIASVNQVVTGSKVVPEPDTLVLVGSGLTIGACMLRRRRRARA